MGLLSKAQAIKPAGNHTQVSRNIAIRPERLEEFVAAIETRYADLINVADGGNRPDHLPAGLVINTGAMAKSYVHPDGTPSVAFAVKLVDKALTGNTTVWTKNGYLKVQLVGDLANLDFQSDEELRDFANQ